MDKPISTKLLQIVLPMVKCLSMCSLASVASRQLVPTCWRSKKPSARSPTQSYSASWMCSQSALGSYAASSSRDPARSLWWPGTRSTASGLVCPWLSKLGTRTRSWGITSRPNVRSRSLISSRAATCSCQSGLGLSWRRPTQVTSARPTQAAFSSCSSTWSYFYTCARCAYSQSSSS